MAVAKKKTTKKATTKKKAVKKATTKKPAAKKAATKKATTKKTTSRKPPAKKTAPKKKAPTKKKTVKKATVKKTPPKKKAVKKKVAAKKTATKKKSVTKAPTKKATAKKAPAKKAATKKATTKAAPKKPVAKKATPQKATKKTTKKASTTKAKSVKIDSLKEAAAKLAARLNQKNKAKKNKEASTLRKEEEKVPAPTAIAKAPTPKSLRRPIRRNTSGVEVVFKINDQIVYPAHGVGLVTAIETQSIAGTDIKLYVIHFAHEKMILRVPMDRADPSGMRHLSSPAEIDKAIELLQGRARIKRTMWSRRAQEYEAKINSGSIKLVAEVVRDLFRSAEQPEQSYSERQLFQAAQDRMAREVAAVRKKSLEEAIEEIQASLAKKEPV